MKYYSVKVTLDENQKETINNAKITKNKSITVKLLKENLNGDDTLNLTKAQFMKLEKARQDNVGISLKLNRNQLTHEEKDDVYEIVQVNIPEKENFNPLSIKLGHADLIGDDTILITKSQYDGMCKALKSKKSGFTLDMNKNQVEANVNAARKLDGKSVWNKFLNSKKNAADEIVDRLGLLLASKDAGNTGLENEIEKLVNK